MLNGPEFYSASGLDAVLSIKWSGMICPKNRLRIEALENDFLGLIALAVPTVSISLTKLL